jgi:dienelactone hydrolase
MPEKATRAAPIRAALIPFAGALALLASEPVARADELVQIAPHRAASPFEMHNAMPPLFGHLARPDRPGRLPAAVVLHWCVGFGLHDVAAAARLKSWGYVALAPDSLGGANLCSAETGWQAEVDDGYAALRWLAAQDFVDAGRVVVIGYSMGATAALSAVERGSLQDGRPEHFRAAVAYYPRCDASRGNLTAPALILIGDRDDWTPAEDCRKLVAHESDIAMTRSAGGEPMRLMVYPGATHAFDVPGPPLTYFGHAIAHDPAATGDAEARVRAFLNDTLH